MKKNIPKDDAQRHLEELRKKVPQAWKNYDIGLQTFKVSVMIRQLMEDSKLS